MAVAYQIQQLPELEFLSDNLTPSECLRFHKLFKRQFVVPGTRDQNGMVNSYIFSKSEGDYRALFIRSKHPQTQSRGLGESLDCKKLLLTSWLTMEPKLPITKAHELLDSKLRQIGRTDLAQWLGYNNVIRQRELYKEGTKSSKDASKGNVT